jgi:periplasmic copper chaperone A
MSLAPIRRPFHLVIVALVAASAGLFAAQGKEPSAVSAWIPAPAAGATDAQAYVEIDNPTMYDIFVLSATAPGTASKVELRAAAAAGAEPAVVTEFPVPSYGSTSAAVGAPHLRLLGLTRPLKAGDAVALTLTINDGSVLKVSAQVRAQ